MISTGTDIKPLECLIFHAGCEIPGLLRADERPGTRTIAPTEFNSVTGDAPAKTHFVIVDAVGVCENDKTDSRPLERKKSVPFDKLLQAVALGDRKEEMLTSLAGRLAALDREITENDRKEIIRAAGGKNLKQLANGLLDAVDPDKHIEKARALFNTQDPTESQIKQAAEELAKTLCLPFDNPVLRNTLVAVKERNDQIIDAVSKDVVLAAGWDAAAKEKAQNTISTFKQFIEDNKDELAAIQFIYGKPYAHRHLTYQQIDDLANAIKQPPYRLTPENIWQAYEQLEKAKVKGAGAQKLLTNIISLIRFTVGKDTILEPFPQTVERRFSNWLAEQGKTGRTFTAEQMEWLVMIKNHIATSANIEIADLQLTPFQEKGGAIRADKIFDQKLDRLPRRA